MLYGVDPDKEKMLNKFVWEIIDDVATCNNNVGKTISMNEADMSSTQSLSPSSIRRQRLYDRPFLRVLRFFRENDNNKKKLYEVNNIKREPQYKFITMCDNYKKSSRSDFAEHLINGWKVKLMVGSCHAMRYH